MQCHEKDLICIVLLLRSVAQDFQTFLSNTVKRIDLSSLSYDVLMIQFLKTPMHSTASPMQHFSDWALGHANMQLQKKQNKKYYYNWNVFALISSFPENEQFTLSVNFMNKIQHSFELRLRRIYFTEEKRNAKPIFIQFNLIILLKSIAP